MSDIEILFRAVGEHLWRVSRRPPQMTFRGLVLVAGVYSSIAVESLFMTPSGTVGAHAASFLLKLGGRPSRSSRSACNQNSKSRPAGRPLISHSSLARARTHVWRQCALAVSVSIPQRTASAIGRSLVGYARSQAACTLDFALQVMGIFNLIHRSSPSYKTTNAPKLFNSRAAKTPIQISCRGFRPRICSKRSLGGAYPNAQLRSLPVRC